MLHGIPPCFSTIVLKVRQLLRLPTRLPGWRRPFEVGATLKGKNWGKQLKHIEVRSETMAGLLPFKNVYQLFGTGNSTDFLSRINSDYVLSWTSL